MRRLALAAAVAAVAIAAGCGGGDDDDGDGGGGNGGAPPAAGGRGGELFAQRCGGCHTLAAFGTSGETGPNLDTLKPDRATVLRAIASGPGVMPTGLAEGADAEAIADAVAQNAGR
jgi:mono/diheme cytochrome c family protein